MPGHRSGCVSQVYQQDLQVMDCFTCLPGMYRRSFNPIVAKLWLIYAAPSSEWTTDTYKGVKS